MMKAGNAPAAGGLERLGWSGRAEGARSVADLVAGEDWLVASVRTGPFDAQAVDLGASVCRAIIGVAGQAQFEVGDVSFGLRPREVLVINGDQPLRARADEHWTRWEWQLTSPPSGLVRARVIRPLPFAVDAPVHRLMGSMTSSLIASPPDPASRAQVFVYRALSQIVVAAVADSLRLGSTKQRLYERAQFVIESRYVDPTFSVEALCRALSTSRSYLYEVFAGFETSPRLEIERRRIVSVLARFDLETLDAPSLSAEVIGISGFSSAKQLRRALFRYRAEGARSA
ncbi:AraC-like DNA-binding protein [Microbacterium resistens]|uniref:AraC-like DNA-binding protein n=1 Tax=Microbacterium resistens TaxID=156977 RepID=A0ABU1S8G2_9MICO|nr:hypothetical protein [Microbacterium resistens]MDR6865845.1 AraC-like DNA-binding protein [Microbacterium resistens]